MMEEGEKWQAVLTSQRSKAQLLSHTGEDETRTQLLLKLVQGHGCEEKYEEEHSTKAGGIEGALPARAESHSAGAAGTQT